IQLTSGGLWLRHGDYAKARDEFEQVLQFYREGDLLVPSACYDLLARLRRFLALTDLLQGNVEKAKGELLALVQEAERRGQRKLVCECRFSYAEALHVAGETEAAGAELRRAMAEAEPMKLMRPLLELQLRRGEWLKQVGPTRKSLPVVVRVLQS